MDFLENRKTLGKNDYIYLLFAFDCQISFVLGLKISGHHKVEYICSVTG